MGEMSPTSGQLASSAPAGYAETAAPQQKTSDFWVTVALLVILGIASLIITEQIFTGWLALGERANILRSNLNAIEIVVAIGTAVWGLVALRTAYGFITHASMPSMEDYFSGRDTHAAPGISLTIALLGVIGVFSLLAAEQVATGWLALGERANIPRSNLNQVEWLVIIAGIFWGIVTLRTVFGLVTRDRRAWAWAQWVVLISSLIGFAALLSGIFDLSTIIPEDGTIIDNLAGLQELTAPGLILFLSCMVVYRFLTTDVDLTAAQVVRNSLAKTPGAGAIIGFFAIFILFSLATDLFLTDRSLAGILATNITRGIVAIGITFLMISGEFDLSVGSVFGAGALVFLLMMTEGVAIGALLGLPMIIVGIAVLVYGWQTGRSLTTLIGIALLIGAFVVGAALPNILIVTVIPALIIALIFAGILGFINGGILVVTGIPSFIITLGTLLAYRAILLVVVADGRILRYADYRLPPPFVYFNRWLLIIAAAALAVVIVFMGWSLISNAWRSLNNRLANYQNDTHDFRDFFLFTTFLRFAFSLIASIFLINLLVQFILAQIPLTDTLLEISFFEIMNGQLGFVASDVNLRAGVFWWLLLVVIFQYILTETRYGNYVLAVGGNPGAARAQGISTNAVKVINFIICSVLAALAGIISVSRLANVDPLMGNGLELEVIAASVIGGALLNGGYGSIFGALLGVLIFGMLQTGLVLVGVDSRAFSGVIGIIIIVAVVINTAVRQARK